MSDKTTDERIDRLEEHITHLTNMQVAYMRMFGVLMNDQEKADSMIDDIYRVVKQARGAGHEPLFT